MNERLNELQNQCEDNSERIDAIGNDLSALFVKINGLERKIESFKDAKITMKLDFEA